jgi:F420-non-reducing hydrogenase small subunit
MAKPKIALYWAASCGGCDIALLQIGEKLLRVIEAADIVFWPVAMDVKYKDVESMADGSIDVCLFNGGIRNSEQERIARMLREKSRIMIAYGACAYGGGIPGLANLYPRESIFERVYQETPSTDNQQRVRPQTTCTVPEGDLDLPEFFETVRSLRQTVPVDYVIPGCPPEEPTTWLALQALLEGKLPLPGTVISNKSKAVCEDCQRKKDVKKVKKFYRIYARVPEPDVCLLEQGFLCAGPATLGGCGALCPQANMPCTGCYGPVEDGLDQGAHLLSAVASVIDSAQPAEIDAIISGIPDPAGTFYRYTLPESILGRARAK